MMSSSEYAPAKPNIIPAQVKQKNTAKDTCAPRLANETSPASIGFSRVF